MLDQHCEFRLKFFLARDSGAPKTPSPNSGVCFHILTGLGFELLRDMGD